MSKETFLKTSAAGIGSYLYEGLVLIKQTVNNIFHAAVSYSSTFLYYQNYSKPYSSQQTTIQSIKIIDGTSYIELTVKNPKTPNWNAYHVGQYAKLNIPKIESSSERPHPFTVVNVTEDNIVFLISKKGAWTSQLFDMATSIDLKSIGETVKLCGPFGKGIDGFQQNQPIAFFVSGIGMTPLLAYLNNADKNGQQNSAVDLFITEKIFAESEVCLLALDAAAKKSSNIHSINLFITQENQEDFKKHISECSKKYRHLTFFQISENKNVETLPVAKDTVKVNVYNGRPAIKELVSHLVCQSIYACGSTAVVKEIKEAAEEHQKRLHCESF